MKSIKYFYIVTLTFVMLMQSCECDNTRNQMKTSSNVSSTSCCDSTLYKTIYNYLEMLDNDDTVKMSKKIGNILLVFDKRKGNDTLICLVAQPCYSFQSEYDDSVIVSYTIIHDWLIRLDLSPKIFNKYKTSFTFVDPNQISRYRKHYDGAFEPILWQYRFQNDSLTFDKKVYY